jgi:hypothetical protein
MALVATAANAGQTGVWQFDNNLDNALPGGAAMVVNGAWSASYSAATIGGNPATVLSFPAFTNTQSLQMPNQAPPSGGALTNSWSIVMDVNFPYFTTFAALWKTDQNNAGSDGDFFVRGPGQGIGISSNYHGVVNPNTWYRIAVTIQPSGTAYNLDKYIDGALVGTTTNVGTSPDGRHAVGAVLNLFADEDGETAAGMVNSVAYYDNVLTAGEIGALGAASAGGIPAIPEPTTLALAGAAALGLLAASRRRD